MKTISLFRATSHYVYQKEADTALFLKEIKGLHESIHENSIFHLSPKLDCACSLLYSNEILEINFKAINIY